MKSMTLTILTDTPEKGSWRIDLVDPTGKPFSYSWSGPQDGSMHPLKAADGTEIAKESLKKEQSGVLVRHGEDAEGGSFDGRATMSADGKTITDIVTNKPKDGQVSKETMRTPSRLRG